MSETKWAFVKPCGCIYAFRYDPNGVIHTPQQAWTTHYDWQGSDARRHDEAAGYTVRLWQDGDKLNWGDCPHQSPTVVPDIATVLF